ncbi:MAG: ribosome recycling factor [Holosporales bacterium]|jgi:ribosome recycling factor|nr:ribosome recycling factor [Holosporales bacterium]
MSLDSRLHQFKNKMELSLDAFAKELSGIRAGRATTALLEPVKVEAYGALMPMNQVGAISAPDARMLSISVWDRELVKSVEKAIRESGANLNPMTDGQTIRVPIPPLSDERRQELSKLAGKYAEDARVALRNIRRDAMDFVKALEKNDEIGEDELKRLSESIQELTDEFSKKVDTMLQNKQKDIMQI